MKPSLLQIAVSLVMVSAVAAGCGAGAGAAAGTSMLAPSGTLEAQKGYVRQAEVRTGVGNVLVANVRRAGPRRYAGGTYIDPVRVTLSYGEQTGYFRAGTGISAWVHVHCYRRLKSGVNGSGQQFDVQHLNLTQSGSGGVPYTGSFDLELKGGVGDSAEVLDFIDVAVQGGGKWDSNHGNNYRLTLGFSQ